MRRIVLATVGAYFHYIMVGGSLLVYLGGLHLWWPKLTGHLSPEWWARVAAGIVFVEAGRGAAR